MRKDKKMVRDWLDLARHDWVYFWRPTRLHALKRVTDKERIVSHWYAPGETMCGRKGDLFIPGFLSRMSMERCKACCRKMGFPEGVGSPKNDKALRPLVGLD